MHVCFVVLVLVFQYSALSIHCLCVTVPSSGFTQRATLDPELNEIHVLTVSFV